MSGLGKEYAFDSMINHFTQSKTVLINRGNWVNEINILANKSLFMKAKNSWYKGDNIPGKPKKFIPYPAGLPQYREICNKVQKKMYKGFNISLK